MGTIRVAILVLALLPAWPLLADQSDGQPTTVDASVVYAKPLTWVGPTTVEIKNLNVVRYHIQISRDSALSDGPSLAFLGFPIPPRESADAQDDATPSESPQGAALPDLSQMFSDMTRGVDQDLDDSASAIDPDVEEVSRKIDKLAEEIRDTLDTAVATKKSLDGRLETVRQLVAVSDNLLAGGGASQLADHANKQAEKIDSALKDKIPAGTDHYRTIAEIKGELEKLMIEPGFAKWIRTYPNGRKWDLLGGRLDTLAESLSVLDRGSDLRKQFQQTREQLSIWRDVLAELDEDSFSKSFTIECGYPFWKKREHTIELQTVDRLESDEAEATRKQTVVRVVCPSSLAISAGISVGGVDEQIFGFVQSPDGEGGVRSTIGLESSGSETVNGLLLGHVRLDHLGASRKNAWYLSTGTLVSLGDSESRLGYVLGGSVSFQETFLLTVGIEARRSSVLAGGFSLGDAVPDGLAEPPTEKEWDFGAVFGISFAFP